MTTYLNNITNEEINKLETCFFSGAIHVISSLKSIPPAINRLKNYSVIGFDTETKPSFKKGKTNKVSLIQLAVQDEVFLFRINKTGLAPELIELFKNSNIVKVGVSIRDDLKKLIHIKKFNPSGFIELQDYSDFFAIESNSLKKLAAIVLGVKVSKSQRLTNWEAPELSDAQLLYAATDAWVCLQIYQKLRESSYRTLQNTTNQDSLTE